jgi:hypothetical protein
MLRGVTTEQSEDFLLPRKRERITPLSREETKVACAPERMFHRRATPASSEI